MTHRWCNTKYPASLYPALILMGICFRIPVSSKSFNYPTAFPILLDGNIYNGTSHLFPSSKMLSMMSDSQHKYFVLATSAQHQRHIVQGFLIVTALQFLSTLPSQNPSQLFWYTYVKSDYVNYRGKQRYMDIWSIAMSTEAN